MQDLKKQIIANAILIEGIDLPDIDKIEETLSDLKEILSLQINETETNADLLIVSGLCHGTPVFLKMNLITNDLWLELQQHRELCFFKLFDAIPLEEKPCSED